MDDDVRNFGIRILASGARSYFVRYRVGGGRGAQMRRITIGRPDTITPEKARKAAKDALAAVRLGYDPAGNKAERRGAITVAELCEEWAAGPGKRNKRGKLRSANSYAYDKARLAHHVIPLIGRTKAVDLGRSDVERLRDSIAAGKTAKTVATKKRGVARVRGGEGASTRTLRTLSVVLSYGVQSGHLKANPALGVRKTPDGSSERFLSPVELSRLGAALEATEAKWPVAVAIIRLLALTGCRRREIEGLQWSEVDLDHGVLRLIETKTGAKNVFLSREAALVVEDLRPLAGSKWVFPATSGSSHYQHAAKVWTSVRAAADLNGVRLHDLRHTFASHGLAVGSSLEVVSALLGHRERRTTERYAHLASDPIREAANRVGSAIGAHMATRQI